MTDANIDSVLEEIKKASVFENGSLRSWRGEAKDKIAPYLYKAHVENHYSFDKISKMCGGYSNWWSNNIANEYIDKHSEEVIDRPHKMPFINKRKNVCNWTAEELLDYFLDGDETLLKISEDLNMSRNWAAQKLSDHFKKHPERKKEFEDHKKEIRDKSKLNKEKNEIEAPKDEKDIKNEVIVKSENMKDNKQPQYYRILFDVGETLEVDLYKGQQHPFGSTYIFNNRLEASNNLAVAAIEAENFIKNNIKFSNDGIADTDIILYIPSSNDNNLAWPIISICSKKEVTISICTYDENTKKYNNAYTSEGNTINKKTFNAFPNSNRVESIGYSLYDLLRFDKLYEVEETTQNYYGKNKYVYKLMSPDHNNIIRAFSNMLSNIVLDSDNMIDCVVRKCRFNLDGVLIDGEIEQSFCNYK